MAVKPLSAVEMFTWMEEGKDALFLDVRSQQEFEDWRIQVTSIPQVCIPSEEFEDESKQAWETLPKDKPINVICRRGRTARIVAEQLDAKGYDVYVLDKGMQEWSQFYNAVTVAEEGGWKLVQIQRLGKGCLSYMLLSGGEAMIVDPGRHTEEYLNLAAQEGVNITCVMDTHLHADHISGAVEIAGKTGAKYFISSEEMQDSNLPYEAVEDNEVFTLGEVEIKVLLIPTPGHTPGSVSFLVNDTYLLSGDTIFVGGLGRPDLGGKAREWAQKLYDTVFHSIAKVADDIVVLPSHFSGSEEFCEAGYVGATLGTIRANNEAMRTEDREAFADLVAGHVGATPPNYTEIVEINRGHVMADEDKKLELEVGPNRCAVKHSS